MPAPKPKPRLSVAEYLVLEQQSQMRHEYLDGQAVAMAGESRQHYRIARNLTRALEDGYGRNPSEHDKHCEIVMEAVKVRVTAERYRYPDVVVSCDPGNDPYFIDNPCFLAEVLSDSTANTDHDQKLEEYTCLPSAERYAIISSDQQRIMLYQRQATGWTFDIFNQPTDVIDVPCLGVSISLAEIYRGIEFV
jgi:Uma2 family endonuclease